MDRMVRILKVSKKSLQRIFLAGAASAVVAIYITPAHKPTPNARAQFLAPWSPNATVVNIVLPETAPPGFALAVLPAVDPTSGDVVLAASFAGRRNQWIDHFSYDSRTGRNLGPCGGVVGSGECT